MKKRTIIPIALLLVAITVYLVTSVKESVATGYNTTSPGTTNATPSNENTNASEIAGLSIKYSEISESELSQFDKALSIVKVQPSSDTSEVWNGEIASSYASGDGSQNNPYVVSNASELALLAREVNENGKTYAGEFFLLTSDIRLNSSDEIDASGISQPKNIWYAIGNSDSTCFSGTFDGGGHTVYGIYTLRTSKYGGLFGRCVGSCSDISLLSSENCSSAIKNINIADSSIFAVKCASAVCAYARDGVLIENCNILEDTEIAIESGSEYSYSGSICAIGNGLIVRSCTSSSYIDGSNVGGSHVFIGGITGSFTGLIDSCGFFGNVVTDGIGGLIAGRAGSDSGRYSGIVANCRINATIKCLTNSMYCGGICGISAAGSSDIYNSIENCIVSADIEILSKKTCFGILSGIHMSSGSIVNIICDADKIIKSGIDSLFGCGYANNSSILTNVYWINSEMFSSIN